MRTKNYIKALENAKQSMWEVIPESEAKFIQFMDKMNMCRLEAISYLFELYNEGTDVKRYIDRVLF